MNRDEFQDALTRSEKAWARYWRSSLEWDRAPWSEARDVLVAEHDRLTARVAELEDVGSYMERNGTDA